MKRGILLLVLLSLIIVNAQFVVSKTVEIEQVNDLSRREIIQCDSCISCTAATNAPAGTIVQLSQDLATDTNCIEIISSDIILDCNNYRIYKIALLDNDTAIYSYNKNRNEIKNCYIENFKRGIEIYSGEDNVVRDNTLDGAASYGVFLTTNANSNLIVSNDFMGSIYNSVRVVNSDNNMISYNTIEDSQKAIFIKSGSYNTTVVGNYIAGSNFYGLSNEDGSDGTVVMTNMVLNTQQYGMIMKDSSNVLFSGNDIINTGLDVGGGLKLVNSNNNYVEQNNIQSPTGNGILLVNSYDNIVSDNTVAFSGGHGIYLNVSSDNVVDSNTVSDSTWSGLKINDAHSNFVAGNNIFGNLNQGILIERSYHNEIKLNSVSDNSINGIYVMDSSNSNILTGNVVSNNQNHGIRIKDSSLNIVKENIASENIYHGIYVDTGMFNNIGANVLTLNDNFGIKVLDSFNNYLLDNFASSNYFSGYLLENSPYNTLMRNGGYLNYIGGSDTDQFTCISSFSLDVDDNYCNPNDPDGCTASGLYCEASVTEDYVCWDTFVGEIDKGSCFSQPNRLGSYCGAANTVSGGDSIVDNCNYCGCGVGLTCDEVNGKCCDNFIPCGEEFDSDCSYVGQEVCCGDDSGEFVRIGHGYTICCNSGSDRVNENGECVGRPIKTDYIPHESVPDGRFSPTGSAFLDKILGLFVTS